MPVVDVHQHVWPEELIAALSRREAAPRLVENRLELNGAGSGDVDVDGYRLDARLAALDELGIDQAVVSLSPTLGIDALPDDQARELVEAYEHGILELGSRSGGRILPLSAGDSLDGFAGACVGAHQLAGLDGLAPLLDRLEERGAFLFVHPGPAQGREGGPGWWGAVVEQTAQLQAAYGTWLAEGVHRWPGLDVVFASLAGGGPFQLERLRAWGVAGRDVLYETVFFETSSYGNRALELCLSTFGVGQLVFGSDMPVIDAEHTLDAVRGFGDAVRDALCDQNPARLLA